MIQNAANKKGKNQQKQQQKTTINFFKKINKV